MKKTKLTRSLMAACSIVALSAVMYGCVHNGGDGPAVSDCDAGRARRRVQTLQATKQYHPADDLVAAIEGASPAEVAAAGWHAA